MASKKGLTVAGSIVGAVAVLAVIMYPGSSALFQGGLPGGNTTIGGPGGNNSTGDASVVLTEEELDICNSAQDEVSVVLGQDNQNSEAALDLLIGTYCTRADLVEDIGSSNYPGIGLVAYACEAIGGTIDDAVAAETFEDFGPLYCSSVTTALRNETGSLLLLAEAISETEEEGGGADPAADAIVIINNATSLAESRPYLAYKELDRATEMLIVLVEIPAESDEEEETGSDIGADDVVDDNSTSTS